jgi:hypothetical protein
MESTPRRFRSVFYTLKTCHASQYTIGAPEQAREESNPASKFWRLLPRHADGPVERVERRSNPLLAIFSRELYRISYPPPESA